MNRKYRRAVEKLAAEFDRKVERRKSGHLALLCSRGERPPIFTSSTSSDHRILKNLQKHLKHGEVAPNEA